MVITGKKVKTQTNEDKLEDSDSIVMISKIAYCKAENRGFEPGHELDDWLEAEQEYLLNEKKQA